MTSLFRLAFAVVLLALMTPIGGAATPDPSSGDQAVAQAVRARLAQPDAAATIHVNDVRVAGGVATLAGSVRDRFALAEAVRVAKEIPGVAEVDAHRVRVEPNP